MDFIPNDLKHLLRTENSKKPFLKNFLFALLQQ